LTFSLKYASVCSNLKIQSVMKNVLFCLFIAVVALSSCKKESISSEDRISEIRSMISSNPEKYSPPTPEEIMRLYREKSGGLKDGIMEPKVGFSTPVNHIILTDEDGNFKLVWAWTIVSSDYLVDKGIIVDYYNRNSEVIDVNFLVGWNNDYCIPVTFSTNMEGYYSRSFKFSYPVTMGNFSFEIYTGDSNETEIYLALLNYDCAWNVYSDNTTFGGTLSFNPINTDWHRLTVGLGLMSNVKYWLKFVTQPETVSNSYMTVTVWDDKNNFSRSTIIYSGTNYFPISSLIAESIRPVRVDYQLSYYEFGILKYGSFMTKECFEVEPGVYSFK